ncbi:iron-containing alcohol dehydrogenase [Gottfriedia acidiceleris]|uniref:Iron-containing alcohol dehydrogenase n=1 Tax=Gottfriedia acidiceleris TaxID=371036 RepID=A0ABY4JF97_9BACI|nr:iron-containing alcohol dehydrogenase [Gottfriedia acidiceleris]UPM52515.1 iron-containing alcohol dehydrogenase [Gottfriedia acidiceleris]
MNKFIFNNPTKLIFGKGQLTELKKEIPFYGKNVLLLYGGGSIKQNGLYSKIIALLKEININIVELGGVEPNPRLTTVNKGIELVRKHNIDIILAVGGGSVIDCAKAIAAGSHYDGDVWDIVTKKVIPSKAIPIGTILTIAATGSEMNGGAVITNWEAQDKRSFGSIYTYPKFSILDPEVTYSVPLNQTIYGIVDIMSHVFEQYFHNSENANLQERFGESILKTMIEVAPKLVNDLTNYENRETMLLSGTLALNGTLSMGVQSDWATHMIEHAVSAVYDIPHGGGLAILFPNWMEFVAKKRPERIIQLGENVFELNFSNKTKNEMIEETIEAFRSFLKSIGAPTKLSDYGIDHTQIDLMAKRAMVAPTIGNYVPLNQEDVKNILLASL